VDAGTANETAGFRHALGHREFRWLALHHLVAGSGQSFGTVAVATVLYQQTGSAAWVGAAAACRLVPYLLCAGPAGVLADRIDRRRLLLWSAVLRAVVTAVLVIGVAVHAAPIIIVALVFLGTALGTGSFPALLAVIPGAVPEHHLPPATAILNTVETAAWLIGPALGGLLLLGGSPETALAANALLFLAGAAMLGPVAPRPAPEAEDHVDRGFAGRLADGARVIVRTPEIGSPLVLVVAVNLALGAAPIILLLVSQDAGLGPNSYAALTAALGVGGFSGVVVTNRLAARSDTMVTLSCSVVTGTAPFLGLLLTDQLLVATVLVAVAGAGMVVTEVVALTVMLRSLPEAVVARVFGLVDSSLVAAVLAGSVIAAPLVGWLGLSLTILAAGLIIPCVGVSMAWLNLHSRRQRAEALALA
jgi:MFS family permease